MFCYLLNNSLLRTALKKSSCGLKRRIIIFMSNCALYFVSRSFSRLNQDHYFKSQQTVTVIAKTVTPVGALFTSSSPPPPLFLTQILFNFHFTLNPNHSPTPALLSLFLSLFLSLSLSFFLFSFFFQAILHVIKSYNKKIQNIQKFHDGTLFWFCVTCRKKGVGNIEYDFLTLLPFQNKLFLFFF